MSEENEYKNTVTSRSKFIGDVFRRIVAEELRISGSQICEALKGVYEEHPLLHRAIERILQEHYENNTSLIFIEFLIYLSLDEYVRWLSIVDSIRVQLRKIDCVRQFFDCLSVSPGEEYVKWCQLSALHDRNPDLIGNLSVFKQKERD